MGLFNHLGKKDTQTAKACEECCFLRKNNSDDRIPLGTRQRDNREFVDVELQKKEDGWYICSEMIWDRTGGKTETKLDDSYLVRHGIYSAQALLKEELKGLLEPCIELVIQEEHAIARIAEIIRQNTAANYEQDGLQLRWKTSDAYDGAQIVKIFSCSGEQLVLPAQLNGKPVVSLGDAAVADLNIAGVVLPDTLKEIGYGNFESCHFLTEVRIPRSVEICHAKFLQNGHLQRIDVEPGNLCYFSKGGILYDAKRTVLLRCPAGKGGFVKVPGTVKKIDAWAFDGCTGLEEIRVTGGTAEIDMYAFRGCANLKSLQIPDSVKTIGWDAFCGVPREAIDCPTQSAVAEYLKKR